MKKIIMVVSCTLWGIACYTHWSEKDKVTKFFDNRDDDRLGDLVSAESSTYHDYRRLDYKFRLNAKENKIRLIDRSSCQKYNPLLVTSPAYNTNKTKYIVFTFEYSNEYSSDILSRYNSITSIMNVDVGDRLYLSRQFKIQQIMNKNR